jgi:hypothetical protein
MAIDNAGVSQQTAAAADEIRALIERWALAVHAGDLETVGAYRDVRPPFLTRAEALGRSGAER